MRARFRWLVCLAPTVLIAQPVKRIPLAAATEKLNAEFIGVTSVRELADGRVILTDGRDQTVYLADFRVNRATVLGTKGHGPNEWQGVGTVHALSGDSSIMGDRINRRWLLFAGAKIVGTTPPDHPGVRAARWGIGDIDRFGRIRSDFAPALTVQSSESTRADSGVVVLSDRNTGRLDTIARIRARLQRTTVSYDAQKNASYGFVATDPDPQAEQSKLFSDGWLAVIRLEPLRIDWRAPGGPWTLGRPLALQPEPVDENERKAILARRTAERQRALGNRLPPPIALEIPSTLPITSETAPRAGPDGRLYLRRRSSASHPNVRYLAINRRGTIDGEIVLAQKEDIVGFGPKSIYVTSKDDDDIQRLRRHPFP